MSKWAPRKWMAPPENAGSIPVTWYSDGLQNSIKLRMEEGGGHGYHWLRRGNTLQSIGGCAAVKRGMEEAGTNIGGYAKGTPTRIFTRPLPTGTVSRSKDVSPPIILPFILVWPPLIRRNLTSGFVRPVPRDSSRLRAKNEGFFAQWYRGRISSLYESRMTKQGHAAFGEASSHHYSQYIKNTPSAMTPAPSHDEGRPRS